MRACSVSSDSTSWTKRMLLEGKKRKPAGNWSSPLRRMSDSSRRFVRSEAHPSIPSVPFHPRSSSVSDFSFLFSYFSAHPTIALRPGQGGRERGRRERVRDRDNQRTPFFLLFSVPFPPASDLPLRFLLSSPADRPTDRLTDERTERVSWYYASQSHPSDQSGGDRRENLCSKGQEARLPCLCPL